MDFFVKLLAFGAIGLGCALAILTYWLLLREQKLSTPQRYAQSNIRLHGLRGLTGSDGFHCRVFEIRT